VVGERNDEIRKLQVLLALPERVRSSDPGNLMWKTIGEQQSRPEDGVQVASGCEFLRV
jgi:hypothetical protein